MKIVIPVDNQSLDAPVCPSFGRAPFFALYDMESKKIDFLKNDAAESQGGAGIKAAQTLVDKKVATLLTYRCGQNAADVLNTADIKIYKAQEGSVSENISKYETGKLMPFTEVHPGFHNHGGGQS